MPGHKPGKKSVLYWVGGACTIFWWISIFYTGGRHFTQTCCEQDLPTPHGMETSGFVRNHNIVAAAPDIIWAFFRCGSAVYSAQVFTTLQDLG
jgi:hypothetical protein